jgi:hypothetical protein
MFKGCRHTLLLLPYLHLVQDDELGTAEALGAEKLDARLCTLDRRDYEPVERAARSRDGGVVPVNTTIGASTSSAER